MAMSDQELVSMVQAIDGANLHPDDELLVLSIVMGDINAEEAEEAMAETVVNQALQAFTPVRQELVALDGQNRQLRQELTRRVQQPVAPQVQPVQPQANPVAGVDEATWFARVEAVAKEYNFTISEGDRQALRMCQYREEKNARQWVCKNRLWMEHRKAGGQSIRKDFSERAWEVVDKKKTLDVAIAEVRQLAAKQQSNPGNVPQQGPAPAAPVTTQSGPSVGPNNPVESQPMATDLDPVIKRQAYQEVAAIAQEYGISTADMAGRYADRIEYHAILVARLRQAKNDIEAETHLSKARGFFKNPEPTAPIQIKEEEERDK